MKKSRESSHYFSRQYPRRRQIRLPARLQISGTMTMPQGSSRWEHTMGAALCSGHGRRRLHVRQRQTPRSAGETSRAVFSSAPIAVFLIQKNPRNREISRIFLSCCTRIDFSMLCGLHSPFLTCLSKGNHTNAGRSMLQKISLASGKSAHRNAG